MVLGPWKDTIRGWLTDDLEVPNKQRHTARRVWERLVSEHGAQVGESTMRRYVARVKAELVTTPLVAVPQTHELGEEAEVDFGEFYAWVGGTRIRLWLFVIRLSGSGKGSIGCSGTSAASRSMRATTWRSRTLTDTMTEVTRFP